MDRETIVENEGISVWYYPDKKIVHHQVHQFVFGDDFRDALLAGIQTLKEKGGTKWLSDDRAHAALAKEDVEWGKNVWTPKALAAGFRHWAIMLPESMVGKMSHRRMIEDYEERGTNAAVFDDVDQAIEWLENQ